MNDESGESMEPTEDVPHPRRAAASRIPINTLPPFLPLELVKIWRLEL